MSLFESGPVLRVAFASCPVTSIAMPGETSHPCPGLEFRLSGDPHRWMFFRTTGSSEVENVTVRRFHGSKYRLSPVRQASSARGPDCVTTMYTALHGRFRRACRRRRWCRDPDRSSALSLFAVDPVLSTSWSLLAWLETSHHSFVLGKALRCDRH